MNKPIIGIVPSYDYENQQITLKKDYVDAVEAAGGIPIIVSMINSREYIKEFIDLCNGIIITGSRSDVNPKRYNQEPIEQFGELNPLREEVDWIVLDIAFEKKIPLWGICYGHQEINVYLGGSLYQDIPTQVSNALKHKQSSPYYFPSHKIRIKENTFLHKIAGKLEIDVNSRHHQAIDKISPSLTPIAWSDDGLIEAYTYNNENHFVFGVQWHPESSWKNDEFSLELFKFFINKIRMHPAKMA